MRRLSSEIHRKSKQCTWSPKDTAVLYLQRFGHTAAIQAHSKASNSSCTVGRTTHPSVRKEGCNTKKFSAEKLTIIRPTIVQNPAFSGLLQQFSVST